MAMARAMALFAFLVMAAFYLVFILRVPRIDLGIFLMIGIGLAAFDLWNQLVRRR